jgi:hypothetical protein
VQIIRKGFYLTKNVEHKGQVSSSSPPPIPPLRIFLMGSCCFPWFDWDLVIS